MRSRSNLSGADLENAKLFGAILKEGSILKMQIYPKKLMSLKKINAQNTKLRVFERQANLVESMEPIYPEPIFPNQIYPEPIYPEPTTRIVREQIKGSQSI